MWKYYAILYKGLEHPWIWYPQGLLELIRADAKGDFIKKSNLLNTYSNNMFILRIARIKLVYEKHNKCYTKGNT